MEKSSRRMILGLTLALSSLPGNAWSQTAQRSTIEGRVRDASGGIIPQASVRLSGAALIGGPRVLTTDDHGYYRFSALLPGLYEVTASAPGLQPATRSDLRLPVETTFDVSLILQVPMLRETVQVSSAALIDVRRSSSPTVFGEPILHDIPTARTLSSVLGLTPGVTTTTPLFGVTGEVSFGGTQGSNAFSVDGVSLTESTLGNQWSGLNYNWLDQVQVVAIGAGAEYGDFTGAVANGVLRSGSNRWSGLGEWLVTPRGWTSDNLGGYPVSQTRPIAPSTLLRWSDLNGQLGGPLANDRAWFFAGSSAFRHDYRQFDYSGPGTTEESTTRSLVKLDAALRRDLTVQGFLTAESTDIIGAELSRFQPTPESSPDYFIRTHAWNTRGTWTPSQRLVFELRGNGNGGTVKHSPHAPATLDGPPPVYDQELGSYCCNFPWSDESRGKTVVTGTANAYGERLGHHDVKMGLEQEWSDAESKYGVAGNRVLTIAQGKVVQFSEWNGDHLETSVSRFAAYVQDRWIVHDRLTLEPGLRLQAYRGSIPARQGILSTRPLDVRIGAAWDLTGRQTTVLRAHYGRYHDPQFGHEFEGFQPNAYSPHTFYAVTPDGPVELFHYSEQVPATIGTDLRQPSVDQWTVGVERSLGAHTTMQVLYLGRRFANFIGYVDQQLSAWTRHEVLDPGPDGQAGTGDDVGTIVVYRPYGSDFDTAGRDLVLANPANAFRRYNAIQLTLTRQLAARWQYQVSFTHSSSFGTVGNEYNTNATYWSLSPLGSVGSNLNVQSAGPGAPRYDYTEGKAFGSYRAPWFDGFMVGAAFRWHNGATWNRNVSMSEPFFLYFPAEPPGTRRMPSLGSLDLRVEKTVSWRRANVGVYVDIFNVTNVGRPTDYVSTSGAFFGQVSGWTQPRTGRLGLRVDF